MSSEMLCVAVAARRGADGFQKHTWVELPAQTTLRAIGRSTDPDGQLLHVEARKDIDGGLSEFAGGMLDRELAFVVGVAHMQYIKCCFAVDRVAAELLSSLLWGSRSKATRSLFVGARRMAVCTTRTPALGKAQATSLALTKPIW
jgi:hypothetical protein